MGARAPWTHIVFDNSQPSLMIDRAATWMERSGKLLLDIEMQNVCNGSDALVTMSSICALIHREAHRWRSFTISPCYESHVYIEIHRAMCEWLRDISLPQLQVLEVGTAKDEGFEWGPAPSDVPKLTHLTARGSCSSWRNPAILFRLTYLAVDWCHDWTYLSCLDVLRQSPCLEALVARSPSLRDLTHSPISPPPLVLHTSLSYLSVSPTAFIKLIPSLRLLALENLHLWGDSFWDPNEHKLTSEYIAHIPKLWRITFRQGTPDQPCQRILTHASLFAEVSTITTVAIQNQRFNYGTILDQLLNLVPPKTDTVVLDDCSFHGAKGAVRKMENRMKEGATRLHALHVSTPANRGDAFTEGELEWFRTNVPDFSIDVFDGE